MISYYVTWDTKQLIIKFCHDKTHNNNIHSDEEMKTPQSWSCFFMETGIRPQKLILCFTSETKVVSRDSISSLAEIGPKYTRGENRVIQVLPFLLHEVNLEQKHTIYFEWPLLEY